MPDNAPFVFSANSLQDYQDCPRRFELKYLLKQSWPAVESEPVLEFEHKVQLGSQFHQLVYQYLNGIPQDVLLRSVADPELESWFHNFLAYYDTLKFERIFAEFPLRISIGSSPVLAVFDLIGLTADDDVWILDWKTSGKIPKKTALAERIQTILYPYALLEAAPTFLGIASLKAENVRMAYAYVHQTRDNVLNFDYDAESHTRGGSFLKELIAEISAKEPGSFTKTSEERRCKFCVYRSLCERGTTAGKLSEMEVEDEIPDNIVDLDFDTQDEIAF